MSAVMVTNNDNQLQAAAHLIGTSQLPLPHRVRDFTFVITFIFLNNVIAAVDDG